MIRRRADDDDRVLELIRGAFARAAVEIVVEIDEGHLPVRSVAAKPVEPERIAGRQAVAERRGDARRQRGNPPAADFPIQPVAAADAIRVFHVVDETGARPRRPIEDERQLHRGARFRIRARRRGERQHLRELREPHAFLVVDAFEQPDREERVGAARERLVQHQILFGSDQVGLVEFDVHHDGRCALTLHLEQDFAVHRARPREAADPVGHHGRANGRRCRRRRSTGRPCATLRAAGSAHPRDPHRPVPTGGATRDRPARRAAPRGRSSRATHREAAAPASAHGNPRRWWPPLARRVVLTTSGARSPSRACSRPICRLREFPCHQHAESPPQRQIFRASGVPPESR